MVAQNSLIKLARLSNYGLVYSFGEPNHPWMNFALVYYVISQILIES